MLPEADLPLRTIGTQAYFDFLGPQDEPWVQALLNEAVRFEGQRRKQLAERLAEPLPFAAPYFKRRAASRVLMRAWKPERLRGPKPATLRQAVFLAAVQQDARADALAYAAQRFELSVAELERQLFCDLAGERFVHGPRPIPTAAQHVLATNAAIAQGVLMKAASVDIHIVGNSRPIVRLAKWRGLLCVIKEGGGAAGTVSSACLEVSGPFALFRHTLLYGRALAELLAHLAWCPRFTLQASCALRGRMYDVTLDNQSPIFPAGAPQTFDSKLEARFAKDMGALALDWDLVREPEPLRADGTLIFPDFLLQHRIATYKRVFIEIIGFWTPDYLQKKLERLQSCGIKNLILCVDADRLCADTPMPAGLPVVTFRRRIDVAAVMRAVEQFVSTLAGDAR